MSKLLMPSAIMLACVLTLSFQIKAEVDSRIIDGTRVSESTYPTVGRVSDTSAINSAFPNNHFCTGTLIAPNVVLTAAHCMEGVSNTAGRFILNGVTYSTSQIFIHPSYGNSSNEFDIALMILTTNVPTITPSLLNRQIPTVGTNLIIVGYGLEGTGSTGTNNNVPPMGFVNVGNTPIDSITSSEIRWNFGPGESNTAPGDSGGPAFVSRNGKLYIAGVTSGGTKDDASFGDLSFDARVDPIVAWIDNLAGTSANDDNGDGGGGGTPAEPTITIASNPNCTPSIPAPGQLATFSVSASHNKGTSMSYSWNFGDGSEGTGSSTTHSFTSVGTYTVTVTVSASGTTSKSTTISVTVAEGELFIDRASFKLNFVRDDRDTFKFTGFVTLLNDLELNDAPFSFDFAEITDNTSLDFRGRGGFRDLKVKVSARGYKAGEIIRSGTELKIQISVRNGFFDPDIELTEDPFAREVSAKFNCIVSIGGQTFFAQNLTGFYKETNRNGTFKY